MLAEAGQDALVVQAGVEVSGAVTMVWVVGCEIEADVVGCGEQQLNQARRVELLSRPVGGDCLGG